MHDYLSWPADDLDPYRLAAQTQAIRMVTMVAAKMGDAARLESCFWACRRPDLAGGRSYRDELRGFITQIFNTCNYVCRTALARFFTSPVAMPGAEAGTERETARDRDRSSPSALEPSQPYAQQGPLEIPPASTGI
jgi:hypothetical protein